jgi:predicted MFS family arabinose efflux permease
VLSFNQPARQAYMVELAGSQNVTQAIALYNSGQTSVRIIGPSIAGALVGVAFIGIEGVYVLISCIYTLPVLTLLLIKARPPEGPSRRRRAILTEFRDGISYVRNHEVLRILVLVGMVPPLLGNHYQQFLPVFASEEVLDVGGPGLGLMATCTGIGAFLGAMTVASFGNMRRRGLVQLSAGALFGAMLVAFGLSSVFPVALLSLVGVGYAFALFQTLNATLTLASSDPEYYGRVSSVQQINNSLGSFVVVPIGILVDALGAPTMMVATGTAIFLFWCFVGLFVSSYRRIELPRREETVSGEAEAAPAKPASA